MSLYNQILAYIEGESSPTQSPHDESHNDAPASSPEPLDTSSPPDESPHDGDKDVSDSSQAPSPPEPLNTSSPHDEANDGGKNRGDESRGDNSLRDLPKNDPSNNGLVTGGKLLSETVDNLTGGGMGKKESVKTPPPVKKDVDPNLFEGGNVNGNVNGNMDENGVRGRYTEFLHRLRTPKLFSGGSVKHEGEDVDNDSPPSLPTHDPDTTLDGGNIDVLPVFPYLIRY